MKILCEKTLDLGPFHGTPASVAALFVLHGPEIRDVGAFTVRVRISDVSYPSTIRYRRSDGRHIMPAEMIPAKP